MGENAKLIRYDAACHALAEARAVDEVKDIRDKAIAMKAYARQSENKDLEMDAAEIRIRAERRIGELMQAQRETEGMNRGAAAGGGKESPRGSYTDPRDETPTLREVLGKNHKHIADRARKMAAVPSEEFESRLSEWRERVADVGRKVTSQLIASGGAHIAHNSGEMEWYTPEGVIEAARRVMGGIDLDPASSDEANNIVQAAAFYSIQDDGLSQAWQGRVWMNPPYDASLIGKFCDKLIEHVSAGEVTQAITLTNNATETRWWQLLAKHATAICFPSSRIKFWSPRGEKAAPLQGQTICYFGDDIREFVEAYDPLGVVKQ